MIVFSAYEATVIEQFMPPKIAERYVSVLADAKPLFERAYRHRFRRAAPERTLLDMAGVWKPLLVQRRQDLPVGETIRKLRRAVEGKSRLRQVRPAAREIFEALLAYSELDLRLVLEAGKAAAGLLETRVDQTRLTEADR